MLHIFVSPVSIGPPSVRVIANCSHQLVTEAITDATAALKTADYSPEQAEVVLGLVKESYDSDACEFADVLMNLLVKRGATEPDSVLHRLEF